MLQRLLLCGLLTAELHKHKAHGEGGGDSWHDLRYLQRLDSLTGQRIGYDDHDSVACAHGDHSAVGTARCMMAPTGVMLMRGCVQCATGNLVCFDGLPDGGGSGIAVVPMECRRRPDGSLLGGAGDGEADGGATSATVRTSTEASPGHQGSIPTGFKLQLRGDGTLVLGQATATGLCGGGVGGSPHPPPQQEQEWQQKGSSGCWNLELEGVEFGRRGTSWGWMFVAALVGGSAVGVGLLSIFNRQVRGKRGWAVLPGATAAAQLVGLVRDGISFSSVLLLRGGGGSPSRSIRASALQQPLTPFPGKGSTGEKLVVVRRRGGKAAAAVVGLPGAVAARRGRQPMHRAASLGDANELRALLEVATRGGGGGGGTPSRSATLDAGDERRWTALHVACASGHLSCASLLLEAGCDASLRDGAGLTALEVAKACKHAHIATLAGLQPRAATKSAM